MTTREARPADAPIAVGRVLPTMNSDGSRRWIRPRVSPGIWYGRRRVTAYALMTMYMVLPHLTMRGKPVVLLNAVQREFTFFGFTFLPTDTLLFMIFLGLAIMAVMTLTALFGRVWCGWGCPQTVWMEFLFRPLERLFEGGRMGSLNLDRNGPWFAWRRLAKHVVYAILAVVLAHTFLAYFVGVGQLKVWITRSPIEHPSSFAVMAVTSVLVFLDFSYFREQTCTIACPYGRWQSVLLDRSSTIVAYDRTRGEPRRRGKERAGAGDCVECQACVQTCPTGIDIRDGLQMECIHCAQCIDACDAIMDSVGRPRGLIRYSSQEALADEVRHGLRWRTVLYPAGVVVLLGAFVVELVAKAPVDVTLLRSTDAPFREEPDGRIANQLRVRVANRSGEARAYLLSVRGAEQGQVIVPVNPLAVEDTHTETTSLFVVLPRIAFVGGRRNVVLHVDDQHGYVADFPFQVLGPDQTTVR